MAEWPDNSLAGPPNDRRVRFSSTRRAWVRTVDPSCGGKGFLVGSIDEIGMAGCGMSCRRRRVRFFGQAPRATTGRWVESPLHSGGDADRGRAGFVFESRPEGRSTSRWGVGGGAVIARRRRSMRDSNTVGSRRQDRENRGGPLRGDGTARRARGYSGAGPRPRRRGRGAAQAAIVAEGVGDVQRCGDSGRV
jgi:hypothetical protein